MIALILATLLVVLSHLLPMMPGARDRLVAGMGRWPYMAVHSTLSLVSLGLLVWAWMATDPAPSPLEPGLGVKKAAVLLMPLAFILIAGRLLARRPERPVGLFTLTATPGSLGTLLWAGLHLGAASDARATIVFAGFALVALAALVKNALTAPPALHQVGWVPLAGIMTGRVRPDWRGLAVALLAGLVLWAALLHAHPHLIGPDPAAYLG
jgi:uncharacterized membrane protein